MEACAPKRGSQWSKIVVDQDTLAWGWWVVWGLSQRSAASFLSSPSPPPQRLSCAPCGVAPSTAAPEQEGWCSLAGHVRGTQSVSES